MKKLAALLTAIVLSLPAAHGADGGRTEGKRPAARQSQKVLKPAQRLAATKRYFAEKASQTAAIIRINAAKLKETVWPDAKPAARARTDQKALPRGAKDEPPTRDSP